MAKKKTCFVAIGFGPKTDYETGRVLDLDKTFEHLIKPVFEHLDIECFRAKEIRHSGIIDVPMYEWLYKADIVVADISTSTRTRFTNSACATPCAHSARLSFPKTRCGIRSMSITR